ncbi:hypothetical protein Fmac_020098 [Flemingia macrophylla]|uniref:Uncharacterized protein n=1 Tax=Flemingia macrophylla TaxID=520843 RepID=A0ABD1M9P5_9FABA
MLEERNKHELGDDQSLAIYKGSVVRERTSRYYKYSYTVNVEVEIDNRKRESGVVRCIVLDWSSCLIVTLDHIGGILCCSLVQSMAANLGVVTGKHLAEHCRTEYPGVSNFILWIIAEIAIVACDIPEDSHCIKHALQHTCLDQCSSDRTQHIDPLSITTIGVRKFLIAFLVFTIAACFMAELGYAKPNAKEVVKGLFVPELKGSGATGLAISLLGAMVMPWVHHAGEAVVDDGEDLETHGRTQHRVCNVREFGERAFAMLVTIRVYGRSPLMLLSDET